MTRGGGYGIAVACDHRGDAAVAKVASRIAAERGHLDLLVNNVWGGYERLNAGSWEEWSAPLWEQPLELFDAMFAGGARALRRAGPVRAVADGDAGQPGGDHLLRGARW